MISVARPWSSSSHHQLHYAEGSALDEPFEPQNHLTPEEAKAERARLIRAIERGLAEADAGLGVDDAEIGDDINTFLDARYDQSPPGSGEVDAD